MTKKITSVLFTFVFLFTITAVAFGQCEKNADSQIVADTLAFLASSFASMY